MTPGITGLDNASVMQAAYDVGIRQLVSDTSVAGQDNPSPNAGIWNALVPGILEIPRYPTDLDYDVSTPDEWTLADNDRGMNERRPTIRSSPPRAACWPGYLLRGANDPWMFHQANTRDFGGGRSLLGDLLGATIDRYLASATFPILSPDMDELGGRVIDRMRLDASGVVATIQPGDKLTVQVANAARVPITGLCTPSAEKYGGQTIAYVDLPGGRIDRRCRSPTAVPARRERAARAERRERRNRTAELARRSLRNRRSRRWRDGHGRGGTAGGSGGATGTGGASGTTGTAARRARRAPPATAARRARAAARRDGHGRHRCQREAAARRARAARPVKAERRESTATAA